MYKGITCYRSNSLYHIYFSLAISYSILRHIFRFFFLRRIRRFRVAMASVRPNSRIIWYRPIESHAISVIISPSYTVPYHTILGSYHIISYIPYHISYYTRYLYTYLRDPYIIAHDSGYSPLVYIHISPHRRCQPQRHCHFTKLATAY